MLISPIQIEEDGQIGFQSCMNTVPLTKVEDKEVLNFRHKTSTGLLPPVVRYVHPSRKIVVFDRPPTKVTIKFFGSTLSNLHNAREQEYDIWLPWTVYIAYLTQGVISDIYLYATDGPFENTKKRLHLLPIPNYYMDGRFCQPADLQSYKTLADVVSTTYQIVWDSNYNNDTTDCLNLYRNSYSNFLTDYMGVDYRDINKGSSAGILHAWSKLTQEQVLNLTSKMLTSDLIPRISYLPTFKYNPSPMRFANYINEYKAE